MTSFGSVYWILRKNSLTLIGCVIVLVMLFIGLAAPVLSPYDPVAIDIVNKLQAPGAAHWFGTDEIGRDIFSRVLYGCRISIQVGLYIVLLAAVVGTIVGSISGYQGGLLDQVIMTVTDILLSFPSLVLAMALAAALGPSLYNTMLAVAIVKIPVYVRLVRGQVLSLKEQSYVKAAQTFGASPAWILSRHIIPNSLAPVLIQITLGIGEAILTASSLSFIGLGAQPPTPEWGAMISTARIYALDQWWYVAFPGIAIFITVVGFNLLGDGIRDLLDPRSKN
ncbi:putative D,D-dipeptide transport system permease protein DdpC [Sporomusa ovata DSM 2662]|uniref:Dipeptide transport system permease protein DppC (TC 3.A.1.5.2) n=1 Tax=Sporomusa ovata TaxID=2378 RepID=A0A0U1KXT5_9FIRM|nr:ABC transporter permease subunit [Sporomusa ovata]EQB29562.1 D,D-dipeptide transport system permease protein DdpC [Sporomusa ovata DSM 2662]CQR72075.1 Dipeptide transport system permease protein DppC (TC 3.A.1.5.2) [Sporomusa ovata]